MRAEDAVGLSFFFGLFAAIMVIVYASTRLQGSRDRSVWLAIGMSAAGVVLMVFGLVTSYLIRISPRVAVEGNIWAVRGWSSRTFKVTDDSGRAALIRCNYRGPGLREGDRARARYIEYNGKLLQLKMLTGSYAGWELEESAGESGPALFAGIGLVCWFAGWRQRRKAAALI